MNRHSYRLVFNRARGALVAVGEGARSVCKSAGGQDSRVMAMAALLLAGVSQAQIVADPNSPGNQRPTVLTAPNGTPVVNIQTPSAAGVSRNTYRQFDVNANGAILNNSRTDAPTQLGGWVQGNPWLAGGSARVILNEINSANPSRLNGWVEVAGQRAEVVIANPAGIQVNGAGFINTSGVTLTTGAPMFNGGSLDAYRVQGGRVLITGNGLDNRGADATTILARAVELNAGLWANHLKMVTGANTVDAATQAPTGAAAPTGPAPTFALDVAQIGGMYAGQIHLIGTEAGLGVNQRGVLSANADRLVLDINGQLSNRGQIYGDQVAIKSPQVNNVGPDAVIAARQRLDITTQALTNQSATIESLGSMSLVATQLSNTNPGLTTRTERFTIPESGAYILINGVRYTEGQLGRCFMCASDRYDDGSNTPRLEFVTPSVQYPFEAGYARQPYQLEVTTGYDAGGEQGWTTVTTPYDYPSTDPAWALFGVPVGEQTQLRARLSAYNQDFMARAHRDFDRVWITSSQTEQTVVTNPGQAARIAAAGDLNIVGGAIHNDNSHILAGGTLDISGSTLSNTQTNGYRTVTDHGTFRRDNIEYSPYRLRAGYYGGGDYVAVRETFTTALGGAGVQGNTSIVPSTSGLWRSSPDPTSRYLIEIDPNFANHRQWISSDYLLSALGVDPLSVHKRLGDSLYEQKLVREQVAQLTGQRFLGDHTDDDAQYRTLLDAGATFAQAHQLRPGIALNADQVAALTSDIVWLVAQEVLLPDGGRTTVLAPQVYVLPREGDLDGSGALLAGRRVNINLSGDLSNAGQIAGRQVVQLNAANVQHMGTVAGRTVHIEAEGDIQLQGGQVVAQRSLEVSAGRDLTLQGTTRSATATAGASSSQLTQLDRVAGLYVTGEVGVLVASAGRDIDLRTVTTAQASNLTANTRNYLRQSDTQEVGSQITSGGSITLTAERDLNARAGSVNATGDLMAAAGGAIRITEGRSTNQGDDARFAQKSGFMSSRTEVSREQSSSDTAVASEFGGRTVHLESLGGNTQIRGSRVIGDQGATVIAQGDIDIQAAQQTHSSSTYRQTTKNGLGAMGGISYGTTEQSTDQRTAQTTAAASTVGTVTGDVTLIAGHSYKQNGSDVLAPGGDINIQAQDIAITEARETRTSRTEETFKSSGVSVSLGGALMSAAQNTTQMASAIQKTSTTRMQALGVAAAGLNLYSNTGDIGKAADALASGDLQNAGSISIGVGSSRSQSVTETQASGSRSSSVAAGGSVSLIASGAESGSHILVRGSDITAGNTARLMAEGHITLEAARNYSEEHSRDSSQSASVGFSLGAQTGITVSASRGKGQGDGYETTYRNTHVTAGKLIETDSSGDTTLKGATVRAGQIVAKVGGDLSIESLQDTATYNERSQSAGFSVTVGPSSSGSISTGKTKIDSDYRSVTEQSGLRAGAGGFQVVVNGHTELKGGAITSTEQAVQDGQNRMESDSLNTSDLSNTASYQANGYGVSAGVSAGASNGSAGVGSDKENANSTTVAAISGIAGNQNARADDAETGVAPIFDRKRVKDEVDAQISITAEFGKQASRLIGDYAQQQLEKAGKLKAQIEHESDPQHRAELQVQARQLESEWSDQGSMRLLAHTLVGGLTGGASGAAGAALGTLTAPTVADGMQEAGFEGALADGLTTLISAAVGAAVGSVAGGAAAVNEVINNFLLHHKLKDEEGERLRLRKLKSQNRCDAACEVRLEELELLDKQRDEQLAPLMKACEAAKRNNCKGEAIAQLFMQANGIGAESMRWESNAGTLGSPFSFNRCPASDKGGCSYGPLQVATDTGLMEDFMTDLKSNPASEAQAFYQALEAAGGVKASQSGDEVFVQTWMRLTALDPQFVQYQIDTLINRNLYPVIQELSKVDVDFNTLTTAQKEMIFSAAVQHGAGIASKTKGADNVLERTFAQADADAKPPSLPDYTRKDLIYGEVEDRMQAAEKAKAKLIEQQKKLLLQQLDLERKKSQLLEQGLVAAPGQVQMIRTKTQALERQIQTINAKVENLTIDVKTQDQYIYDAGQYLKSKAKSSMKDGEQFIRDFYEQRTQMYPSEANRYKQEMESILKQYRAEQKDKKIP